VIVYHFWGSKSISQLFVLALRRVRPAAEDVPLRVEGGFGLRGVSDIREPLGRFEDAS
jgi:hypothetical protein